MTVRLLLDYLGQPANTLITLSSAEETAMIAAKMASSDLTGGTVYVAPVAQAQFIDADFSTDTNGNVTGLVGPSGGSFANIFHVENYVADGYVFNDKLNATIRDAAVQAALDAADSIGGGTVLWSKAGTYEAKQVSTSFVPAGSVNAGYPNAYTVGDNTRVIIAEGVNLAAADINSGTFPTAMLGFCNKTFITNRVYIVGFSSSSITENWRIVTINAPSHGMTAGKSILIGTRSDTTGTWNGVYKINSIVDADNLTIKMWKDVATNPAGTLFPAVAGNNCWFYPCNTGISIELLGVINEENINRGGWLEKQSLRGFISFNKVAGASVRINDMRAGRIMLVANSRNISVPYAVINKHGSGIYLMGNTMNVSIGDVVSVGGEDTLQMMVYDNNMAFRDLDGTFAQGDITNVTVDSISTTNAKIRAILLASAPKAPSVQDPSYDPLTEFWTIDNITVNKISLEIPTPSTQLLYFGVVIATPNSIANGMFLAGTTIPANAIYNYGSIRVADWTMEDTGQSTADSATSPRLVFIEGSSLGTALAFNLKCINLSHGKSKKSVSGLVRGFRYRPIVLGSNSQVTASINIFELVGNDINFDRDYSSEDPILFYGNNNTTISNLEITGNKFTTTGTFNRTKLTAGFTIGTLNFTHNSTSINDYSSRLFGCNNSSGTPAIINVRDNGVLLCGGLIDNCNAILTADGVDMTKFSSNGGTPYIATCTSANHIITISYGNCTFRGGDSPIDNQNLTNTYNMKSRGGNNKSVVWWLNGGTNGTLNLLGGCADLNTDISLVARANGCIVYNTNAALGTLGAAGLVVGQGTAANSWHLLADPTKVY